MSNVYAAPGATFSAGDADVAATTRLFAIKGRIGRLRWFAYTLAFWVMASTMLGVVVGMVAVMSARAAANLTLPLSLCVWVLFALVSRRRMHDIGMSALYLLGLLVPFVNLYFLFILIFKRGDEGANEYGPAPAPNNRSVYLLLGLLPATVLLGILAAIVLPAYKNYTDRARAGAPPVPVPAQQSAQTHR